MCVLCPCFRSVRAHFRVDAIFTRNTDDEQQQRVPAYFSTPVQDIDMANPLDIDTVIANLSSQFKHWNARASGFVLDMIKKFVIVICKYRPLQGSSWLETPQWLARKQATVNVSNTSESYCFVWSLVSCIHRASHHADKICHYPDTKTPSTFPVSHFQCPSKISPNLNTRTHPSA